MVQFIVTILVQNTRLTPDSKVVLKRFFCFSEKHRMDYARTRFTYYETSACEA